jgi:hypothetical protein
MNQKDQNKKLTEFKAEYSRLLLKMQDIENEALELLGHSPENDIAWHVLIDYLNGNCSLKDLRADIKEWTAEAMLHQKK